MSTPALEGPRMDATEREVGPVATSDEINDHISSLVQRHQWALLSRGAMRPKWKTARLRTGDKSGWDGRERQGVRENKRIPLRRG